MPINGTQSWQVESQQSMDEFKKEIDQSGPLENYAEQPPEPLKPAELFKRFQEPPLNNDEWLFRGQSYPWPLKPSIERIVDPARVRLSRIERQLIRDFQSHAHHYIANLPGEQEELEWLALMQDYGAPTRLLDWSRSPYVAAFFALEERPQPGKNPVIWAINRVHLLKEAWRTMNDGNPSPPMMPPGFEKTPGKRRHPFQSPLVRPWQPSKMNQRLTIQQGCFLYSDPRSKSFPRSFEESLRYVLAKTPDKQSRALHKLEIDPKGRLELLSELDRMNINSTSLFPGLDGFARSLRTKAEILAYEWYGPR